MGRVYKGQACPFVLFNVVCFTDQPITTRAFREASLQQSSILCVVNTLTCVEYTGMFVLITVMAGASCYQFERNSLFMTLHAGSPSTSVIFRQTND